MYSVISNENSQQHDCPKAKKSKTDDDEAACIMGHSLPSADWERLPAVILDDIFQYLSFEDTIQAASTCHNWRPSLYHPRKWQTVNFVIDPKHLGKAHYFRTRAGHIAIHATVRFNSIDAACVNEFLQLLKCFIYNNNLQSLSIEPSHSTIEIPETWYHTSPKSTDEFPLFDAFADIYTQHNLTILSLGCNEELFEFLPDILALLNEKKADKIETLALATVKEDSCNYPMQNLDVKSLTIFCRLQILSLDYDNLNDDILDSLREVDDLRRIVVHIHGIWEQHPGTSENGWLKLRKRHPNCLLRLSCIHSTDEVKTLHTKVLKTNMPLSHLKVLFSEQMNCGVLIKLRDYCDTFVSLMWVDNVSSDNNKVFLHDTSSQENIEPLELVFVAWQCRKLEELVCIGYKFYEEDWIGFAKLRADTLRRMEVANSDIIPCVFNSRNLVKEVSKILEKSWAPLADSELHHSIIDQHSSVCDTDEYLMPILLADIH